MLNKECAHGIDEKQKADNRKVKINIFLIDFSLMSSVCVDIKEHIKTVA